MEHDALWALIGLVALAFLFYGPWQSVCTDYGRQIVFEKRDAIFDMAMRGELDFRSSEYKVIRASLEKSIRFAHELTLPKFLLFRWRLRRMNLKQEKSDLFRAIEAISDKDVRERVHQLVGEAFLAMVVTMIAKSPLTICCSVFVGAASYFSSGLWSKLMRSADVVGELVQVEAENAATSDLDAFASVGR